VSDHSLQGKTVLITGGAKNLGGLLARDLAAQGAKAAIGSIDIAVNTTGMVIKKPIAEITESDYDKIFAINSKTAFFFIQEAGKHLSDGGKLVTLVTSLLAAYTGPYSNSIYAGSKSAVEHFTRRHPRNSGTRDIRGRGGDRPDEDPVLLRPGNRGIGPVQPDGRRPVEMHRDGSHRSCDIVRLIRFLVSDGWWITGQTIFANGGYTTP